jgi:hypothetical protein
MKPRHAAPLALVGWYLIVGFSPANAGQGAFQTFTDPSGFFEFQYPDSYVVCRPNAKQPEMWEPLRRCNCREGVTVCLGGGRQYKNYSGGQVSLLVDLVNQAMRPAACLAFPDERHGTFSYEAINGIRFRVKRDGDCVMGYCSNRHTYRTSHDGRCYEL